MSEQTEYGQDVFGRYSDGQVIETMVMMEGTVGRLFEQATQRFAEIAETRQPGVYELLPIDKLDALVTAFRLCLVAELELDARQVAREDDPALD